MIFLFLFLSFPIFAKDYGIHGTVYPIREPDLLEEITHKAKTLKPFKPGPPKPAPGITKTQEDRIFYYDPSITLPYDLKDHEGRVFYKAGTHINPLEQRSLTKPLVFIDGEDEDQITWAQGMEGAKVILTSGNPFQLMERLQRAIFFDQNGKLTQKLGIHHVPALVSQEGLTLKIEEKKL